MPPPRLLELPDRHQLAFAEWGDPAGIPVLFLPDLGHSRLARHPDDAATAAAGVRLVTIDRPGYGASTRRQGREMAGLAADVRRLMNFLGIDRFAVLGWAGGAPHALALGFGLGRRVGVLGLAAALPPPEPVGPPTGVQRLLRNPLAPALLRRSLRRQASAAKGRRGGGLAEVMALLPPVDRAAMTGTAGFPELYAGDVAEAYAQGIAGLLDDGALVAGSWGFTPEQIPTPVHLWHGDLDDVVALADARALADRLPRATFHPVPDHGHLLVLPCWTDLLARLVQEMQAIPSASRTPRPPVVEYKPRGSHRVGPRRPAS